MLGSPLAVVVLLGYMVSVESADKIIGPGVLVSVQYSPYLWFPHSSALRKSTFLIMLPYHTMSECSELNPHFSRLINSPDVIRTG